MKRIIAVAAVTALLAGGLVVFNAGRLKAEDAELMAKIEEIADTQKRILGELSAMREELGIIKIRITQNQ